MLKMFDDFDHDVKAFTLLVGIVTVMLAGISYRRAQHWKRVELASTYLKELSTDEALVFACRCLDWNECRLVLPEGLRPLNGADGPVMEHDRALLKLAMDPGLTVQEASSDIRLQVYRTAIDNLLSWMQVLANSIERGLFESKDLPGLVYWVMLVSGDPDLTGFMKRFGYDSSMASLRSQFSEKS